MDTQEVALSTDTVEVASGVFAKAWARIGWDWGHRVFLEVVAVPMTDDGPGRFECTSITVQQRPGQEPVSSERLRQVPVAKLVRLAGAWMMGHHDGEPIPAATAERLRAEGPTVETLQAVAQVYRTALLQQELPTKAVRQTFGVAGSTAGRWVGLARQRGLLAPAVGAGKAGG